MTRTVANQIFTLLNANCPSIVNKATQLEGLLLGHDVETAALTKTWLNCNICDNEFVFKNFRVFFVKTDMEGAEEQPYHSNLQNA